jgi:flagellar assembly protein FliH
LVVKAKSDKSIGLMTNIEQFSKWQAPQLGNSHAPSFRQPVEEDEPQEISEAEKAQALSDEIKAIKQAAYDEGFKAGQDKGFDTGKAQIEQIKSQLMAMVDQLVEPVKHCGEATQQQLLELAFSIARQIVRRELRQDPTQLIAIVREAIQLLPMSEQKIDLYLHPEDALMLIDTLSIDASNESSRWQIKQDPAIERGSCQVMTQDSKVDASLDKQIAVLFNRMVGGLRAGESNKSTDKNDNEVKYSPELKHSSEPKHSPEPKHSLEQESSLELHNEPIASSQTQQADTDLTEITKDNVNQDQQDPKSSTQQPNQQKADIQDDLNHE